MKKNADLIFNDDLDRQMANVDFSDGLTVDEVPILKARQARKQAEQAQLATQIQMSDKPAMFESDVWQLIKSKANNKQLMADINGFLRVYLA